jgi:Zn-dependent oligopeptidase
MAATPLLDSRRWRLWVVPHTHWDREWYLPLEDSRIRLAQVVDELIETMEARPELRFTLDGQAILLEDYLEIRPGMEERLREGDRIASASGVPDFENTIAALERSGRLMERVQRIYGIWSGNLSAPDFQSVHREMAPKLAALSDKIVQNEKLFTRMETIYNPRE